MIQYKGTTALVTGASKGLGAAYARALAARGTNLVLVARSTDALQALADELSARRGVRCTPIAADLAAADATAVLVEEIDRQGLQIDLLINNAGLGLPGDFLSHDIENELSAIQVNIQALLGLSHRLGTRMAARGRGGIINLSSNSAFMPIPAMATYSASKAFILHFTEALRHEMAAVGVKVMVVCPGLTATSFFEGTTATIKDSAFDSPEQVVEGSLRDFEQGRSISYPGRASVRRSTLLPRFVPRDVVVRLGAEAMRRMGLAV